YPAARLRIDARTRCGHERVAARGPSFVLLYGRARSEQREVGRVAPSDAPHDGRFTLRNTTGHPGSGCPTGSPPSTKRRANEIETTASRRFATTASRRGSAPTESGPSASVT